MKKIIGMFAFAMVLVMPFAVNAASLVPYADDSAKAVCDTETCTREIKVYFKPEGGDIDLLISNTIKGVFEKSKDEIVIEGFTPSSEFKIEVSGLNVEVNSATPVLKISDDILVGTVEYSYPNELDGECELSLEFTGSETVTPEEPEDPKDPENPDTGVELPLAILGVGLTAGIGVYLISRKNTKMYKM